MNVSKKIKYFFKTHIFLIILILSQQLTSQTRKETMDKKNDLEILSKLNSQFIENYISMDTIAHNEIIHNDFVCIESSGQIVNRDEYMKDWATSYEESGFTSFGYTDEHIRIFEDFALVRSKTLYTLIRNGETISGSSIYTDSYIKENGRWWCVQAQITSIKK
jgi:hypothetical protein